jgi:hypothetical protein
MKNIKELEISEMVEISGGSRVAYELGYELGTAIRRVIIAFEIITLFK